MFVLKTSQSYTITFSFDRDCYVYTPTETCKKFKLDDKTLKFLTFEGLEDGDPLLILNFMTAEATRDKQIIIDAIVQSGGRIVSDNVLQFLNFNELKGAKRLVQSRMLQYFFSFDANIAQRLQISNEPTILTTCITRYAKTINGDLLTEQEFQFFEMC